LPRAWGKPTRSELLAKYYLCAAGSAAVWIDAEGHVGPRWPYLLYERVVVVDPLAKSVKFSIRSDYRKPEIKSRHALE
jgi:hypothetical protein